MALYAAQFVVEGVPGVFEEEVVELAHVDSVRGGGEDGIVLLVSDGHHSTTQIVVRFGEAGQARSWAQALTTLTAGNGGIAARPPAAAPQPLVPRDQRGQMVYDVDALARRVDATLTRIPAPPPPPVGCVSNSALCARSPRATRRTPRRASRAWPRARRGRRRARRARRCGGLRRRGEASRRALETRRGRSGAPRCAATSKPQRRRSRRRRRRRSTATARWRTSRGGVSRPSASTGRARCAERDRRR